MRFVLTTYTSDGVGQTGRLEADEALRMIERDHIPHPFSEGGRVETITVETDEVMVATGEPVTSWTFVRE